MQKKCYCEACSYPKKHKATKRLGKKISALRLMPLFVALLAFFFSCEKDALQAQETRTKNANSKKPNAREIFDTTKSIIFEEDFKGDLKKWVLAINNSGKEEEKGKPRPVSSDRVQIIPAPGLPNQFAAQMELPGAVKDFRTELALPYEPHPEERWYSERIAIKTVPTDEQGYIFMQWHATKGVDKADNDRGFPNMSLKIKGDKYVVSYSYGDLKNIQRTSKTLGDAAPSMQWVNWVVHAKWSTKEDGLVEIWRDGKLVFQRTGQNLYFLSKDRTPYFKTGIYRPYRKQGTSTEPPTLLYIAGVRIGSAKCTFNEIAFAN